MGIFDVFKINQYKSEIANLQKSNEELQQKHTELNGFEYFQVKEKTQPPPIVYRIYL